MKTKNLELSVNYKAMTSETVNTTKEFLKSKKQLLIVNQKSLIN